MPCVAPETSNVAVDRLRRVAPTWLLRAWVALMSELWLGALALMFVLEGLLPLLNPGAWRRVFEGATQLTDGQLRFVGLGSVAVGGLLLVVWL